MDQATTEKPVTVKAAYAAIKGLGLVATRYDGEWRVTYPLPQRSKHGRAFSEDMAAYTRCNDDAVGTAKAMAKKVPTFEDWKKRTRRK